MGDDERIRVELPRERQHFVENVRLILHVTRNAFLRRTVKGVQTFTINAIDAVELQQSLFDRGTQRLDQPPVLVIVESSGAGRKDQHPRPA